MKNVLILLIKFYRKFISPMKTTKCPYYPSCSEYGLEAVQKYGAIIIPASRTVSFKPSNRLKDAMN